MEDTGDIYIYDISLSCVPQHLAYNSLANSKTANTEGSRGEHFHEVNGQGWVFLMTRFGPRRGAPSWSYCEFQEDFLEG